MTDEQDTWLQRRKPIVRSFGDLLVVVVGVVLMGGVIWTPWFSTTALQRLLGLVFVFFFPGYAIISLLFPEANVQSEQDGESSLQESFPHIRDAQITGIERLVMSFGMSVVVIPLIGLALWTLPGQLTQARFFVSLSAVTMVSTVFTALQRIRLPQRQRFEFPLDQWIATIREGMFHPESKIDFVLNVLVGISLVAAVVSVPYAILVPTEQASYSQITLLTQSENGSFVAGDYPTEFTRGEPKPVFINITNRRQHPVNYTLVVELQRLADNGTVTDEQILKRFTVSIPAYASRTIKYNIRPTMAGTNLRLTFLLYNGQAPSDPSITNSYRSVHIWISVTNSE